MTRFAWIGLGLIVAFFGGIIAWGFLTEDGRERRQAAAEERQAQSEAQQAATDAVRSAVDRWLSENKRGMATEIRDAPNWAGGPRKHVRSSMGVDYLFYFGGGWKICGVWTQEPRAQIYRDESC